MGDRISALEAEKAALEARPLVEKKSSSSRRSSSAVRNDPTSDELMMQEAVGAQLRLDLAEAMRSKGVSDARLRTAEEELDKLRSRTKDDSRNLRLLDAERANLTTRLKDREYELREKRKLLEVKNTFTFAFCSPPPVLLTSCLRVMSDGYGRAHAPS